MGERGRGGGTNKELRDCWASKKATLSSSLFFSLNIRACFISWSSDLVCFWFWFGLGLEKEKNKNNANTNTNLINLNL